MKRKHAYQRRQPHAGRFCIVSFNAEESLDLAIRRNVSTFCLLPFFGRRKEQLPIVRLEIDDLLVPSVEVVSFNELHRVLLHDVWMQLVYLDRPTRCQDLLRHSTKGMTTAG
jgi:hypothetical protein